MDSSHPEMEPGNQVSKPGSTSGSVIVNRIRKHPSSPKPGEKAEVKPETKSAGWDEDWDKGEARQVQMEHQCVRSLVQNGDQVQDPPVLSTAPSTGGGNYC